MASLAEDRLSKSALDLELQALTGFPEAADGLAYEPVQRLLAVWQQLKLHQQMVKIGIGWHQPPIRACRWAPKTGASRLLGERE